MTFLCLVDRKNWEGSEVRRVHQESLRVHHLNFFMTFSLKVLTAKRCLLLPSELPALFKATCSEVIYLQRGSPVPRAGWRGDARSWSCPGHGRASPCTEQPRAEAGSRAGNEPLGGKASPGSWQGQAQRDLDVNVQKWQK